MMYVIFLEGCFRALVNCVRVVVVNGFRLITSASKIILVARRGVWVWLFRTDVAMVQFSRRVPQ